MTMSLYEIDARIEELTERLVDPETGEIDEEVLAELDQLDIDLDEKLESYGVVIKSLKAEIEALTAEKKAIEQRIRVRANRITRMSELVNRILKGEKKKYPKAEFSYRKSKAVEIVNEELVPDYMCRFETVKRPVKANIKDVLDNGGEVPGCRLVISNNLQIK